MSFFPTRRRRRTAASDPGPTPRPPRRPRLGRARPSVEGLERRRLLAAYDGFGAFLTASLDHIETDALAGHATATALPLVGAAIDAAAAGKSILPNAPDTTNIDTPAALRAALQNAFGPGTTVTFADNGTTVRVVASGTTTLAVPKADMGLSVVQFATSQPLSATASWTVDVTVTGQNTTFRLDADAADPELSLTVLVRKQDVPALDATIGPLHVKATPVGADADPFLNVTFAVNVTGGSLDNSTPYAATSKSSGSAHVVLDLDGTLRPSSVTTLNPHINSRFDLLWAFGDANGNPQTIDASAGFGQAPTVTFRDVTLDLGSVVKDLGGKTLGTVLDKVQPLFALASTLDAQVPVLRELTSQIRGLIGDGSTGIPAIDDLAHSDPTVLGLLDAFADVPVPGKSASDSAAIHSFVALVRQIQDVSKFAKAVTSAAGLTLNFGDYTFGGGTDLRTATGALVDQTPAASGPAVPLDQQTSSGDPAAFLAKNYHLKSDLLSDPLAPVKLLLGSPGVSLIEYDTGLLEVAAASSVALYTQNFVIGVVPANFQISLNLPAIAFRLDAGFDSRGLLATGATDVLSHGLFVSSGGGHLLSIGSGTDPSKAFGISFDFGIGANWGAVELRTGVRAGVNAVATIDLARSGKVHLDEINADCPLTGNLTVNGNLSLFADSNLDLSPQALLTSLKSVVELAIQTNPYLIAAKAFLDNKDVTDFLENQLHVSPADIENLREALNENPLDGLAKGLSNVHIPTSEDFQNAVDKAKEKLSDARDQVCDSNPVFEAGCDAASGVGNLGGLFLAGGDSSKTLLSKTLLSWDFLKGCTAIDGGGSSINNAATTTFVPELGSLSDGVLTLFIGALAGSRNLPDNADNPNEVVTIRPADPANPKNGSVVVTLFGYSRQYDGVTKVVGDGGDGNDTIDAGGTGVDANFAGGSGDDLLIGPDGDPTLDGGTGDDTLIGGNSADTILGGDGNDSLVGGGGDDYLDGGAGDDRLIGDFAEGTGPDVSPGPGQVGDDTIYGGDGDDYIYVGRGDDFASGEAGDDTVRGGVGNDSLFGGAGNDVISGSSGNDSLDGGAGTDTLYGLSGNDVLIAGAETDATDDVLSGGADNDTLYGTAGDNVLFGDAGNDRIYAYLGNDFADGGDNDDTVFAGGGNDSIVGNLGNDFLDGGDGSDAFFYSGGDGLDVVEGGVGQDAVFFSAAPATSGQYDASPSGTRVNLSLGGTVGVGAADVEQLILASSGAADTFHVGNLTGTATSQVLIQLSDAAGSTVTLDGTDLADTVAVSSPGANAQDVAGLAVPVQVRGSHAGDVLVVRGLGGGDDLTARAGAQADVGIRLDGGDGNDTLTADATLLGGAGDDTIIPLAGGNVVDGGTGFDTILVGGIGASDTITVTGPASNLQISQAAGGVTNVSQNVVTNVELISVTGQGGDDTVTLSGLTIPTRVDAGDGNDSVNAAGVTAVAVTLLGGTGDDTLVGSNTAATGDRIEGGDGNDNVTGGRGNDTVLGGDGSDTFVWNAGDGSDTVEGQGGQNALVLNGRTAAADTFSVSRGAGRLAFAGAAGDAVSAAGVQQVTLNAGGGGDSVTVNDLTGTDVAGLGLTFGALATPFTPDGVRDAVTLNLPTASTSATLTVQPVAGQAGASQVDVGGVATNLTIGGTVATCPAGPSDDLLTVNAGPDDDHLVAVQGVELKVGMTINAGDGADSVRANATINGGAGNDSLSGAGGDCGVVVSGGDGNDLVTGNDGGNDTLDGGAGNDSVYGLGGNDSVTGGDGRDFLAGGDGNDAVSGQAGADTVLGGAGNDSLDGGLGNDLLLGDADADPGTTTVLLIDSGQGDDSLTGGAGDDTLNGDLGNDTLLGGDGNDTLGPVDLFVSANLPVVVAPGSTLPFGAQVGHFTDAGNDRMDGGAGDDTVNGDAGDDTLFGSDGNDLINGDAGNDSISGGLGNDTVNGGDGADVIQGDAENDVITGGLGNDVISGGDGDDVVAANAGDDLVSAGLGNDTVSGGDGNDTISGDGGNDLLVGDAGNDSVSGGDGNDSVVGSDGNDTLSGDAGADLVMGGAGADLMSGGDANDTLVGGDGNDTVSGDAGADLVTGDAGDDSLLGGDGNDSVYAGAGNDVVLAGVGNDVVSGGAGNDVINGGAGDDAIDGGDGNDTIGMVTVSGVAYDEDGNDTVTAGAGDDSVCTGAGNDVVYAGAGNDVVLAGLGNDWVSGGDGNDQLWGDAGDDVITADGGNDSVVGGLGNDSVDGGDGDDLLFGNEGNDTVFGAFGNDAVYGGAGNDTLYGGTLATSNVLHANRPPAYPSDGDDLVSGGAGNDRVDGGNGNNLLDAGDDGIRESMLGGRGNDYAFVHARHDVYTDFGALDGGHNRSFKDPNGSITDPPLPAERCAVVAFPKPTLPLLHGIPIQPGAVLQPTGTPPAPSPNLPKSAPVSGGPVVKAPAVVRNAAKAPAAAVKTPKAAAATPFANRAGLTGKFLKK